MTDMLTSSSNRASFPSLGTTAEVVVVDPRALDEAVALLRAELDAIDAACSRFRADSEVSRLHEQAGRPVRVGPVLAEALAVSLYAARATDGLVDPTVGTAVRDLGYDADFAALSRDDRRAQLDPVAVPGWWRIALDEAERFVLLPHGIRLDLGATAKALAADRAATGIEAVTGSGVLVNLGGDVRIAGDPPPEGWRVRVCEDHAAPADIKGPVVHIDSGGLATSSTSVRRWHRAGRAVHHIVDPRTGDAANPCWASVTVAAATCVEANTASTASVVLGEGALDWLRDRALPARLVAADGMVVTVCGWPDDQPAKGT